MMIRAVHEDRPASCADDDPLLSPSVGFEYSTEDGDAGSSVSDPMDRSGDCAKP
jgi:hypothetical protein